MRYARAHEQCTPRTHSTDAARKSPEKQPRTRASVWRHVGRIRRGAALALLLLCAAMQCMLDGIVLATASDLAPPLSPSLSSPPPHFLLAHAHDNAMHAAGDPAWSPPPKGSRVLVLGSAGLVGRATAKVGCKPARREMGELHNLDPSCEYDTHGSCSFGVTRLPVCTQWVRENGYELVEVRDRNHIDLRVPHSLDGFINISFVMFLACEVGGSKFMQDTSGNTQLDIIANNIKIYQTVFDFVAQRRIPFLFSSTSLVAEPDAYGTMKRLGESWVKALHLGKIARLWNIYGTEPLAPSRKSHVLADWAAACVRQGSIHSLTDGSERRQFVQSDDTAAGLGAAMEHYDAIELVTDITSNVWLTMREVGAAFEPYCSVHFAPRMANPRSMLESRMDVPFHQTPWWRPQRSLQQGVAELIEYYREMEKAQRPTSVPTPADKEDL